MRKLLIIPFLLFTLYAEAVPPSRIATYVGGTEILVDDVGGNEDSLFNYLQAGVDTYADETIVNADIHPSANIQSDKLNLTAIAQSVANSGSTTLTGSFAADGTTNSIGNGGSDTLTLNVPGGMTLSAATTWTLTGALTFSGTIADLGTVTTADINGGTMDGVQIGDTTATGELIVNDASDDADGLGSQGTSGQYLQSAGAGANPTFVTPLGVLLSTTTFSAAASTGDISITAGKRYFGGLQFDDDSTATDYAWWNQTVDFAISPTIANTGDDADTDINIYTTGANDACSCSFWVDAYAITIDASETTITIHGTCIGWDGNFSSEFRGIYKDAGTLSTM